MVSFVWEICSILRIWQHWMIGVFTHGADWSIRTCSLNMVKVLGGFIEQTLFLYLGIFWCLVTNICNEMFIYFLLFVLFQFWNSSQRNGWRLQSFGDVRFSRRNRFLKQNQPFNSRPHTYFQSRSQCNCQRMKLNLQLFEGTPQYYYCILHSQYIEYLANFFLYLLAEKSITEYLAVLWHSTLLTSMK